MNYFLKSFCEDKGFKAEQLDDGSVSIIVKQDSSETVRAIVWTYRQAREAMRGAA